MKKRILSIVLCLVMVFSLLPFTASAAGATPIDEKNFPDPVFREYVHKVAGSYYLTDTIVRQIEALDVSKDNIKKVLGDRAPITNLKGIRHLKYVRDLNCQGQELTTLDLELNMRVERLNCRENRLKDLLLRPTGTSLKYLNCMFNGLTALDLSKSSELTELYCTGNKLTALDLSANKKLQKINASSNELTTLDVRNLPELTFLDLQANYDLKSIDVSKNTKLEKLNVAQGKLTSLNVKNNRMLVELYVFWNQLTALDVRSNYLLKELDCNKNKLTALDLSSNVALEYLSVGKNPITELNLRAQSNLQKLSCREMKLTKLDVSYCPELRELYCYGNQIETLDLRSNKKLQVLECQNNRLSWLDLSSNTALDPAKVDCSGNVYGIKVDRNLQYKVYPDLPCYGATEGTYFTAARASGWTGGTVSKVDGWDVLTLNNASVKEVTYKYDTGNAKIGKVAFTLKTEVPAAYVVSKAALTVQSPVAGESAANPTVTTDSGAKYVVERADWRVSGSMTVYTGAFEKGKSYTLNVLLAPKSSYHLADSESMQVTVNGKKAEKVLPYKGGKLIVTATFTVEDLITISFDPNGGTGTMQPMKVKSHEEFELPKCTFTPPEGKEFDGWLAENGKVYPAGDIVYSTDDSVLKATWKSTRCDGGAQCPGRNFSDMPAPSWWSHAGLDYCVEHGILSGVGDGKISPSGLTTRAQFVQMLYSIEGKPAVSGELPFTDLPEVWYRNAILWAYQTGVTSGTSDTTFSPYATVTRAQVATFLMKYAKAVCNVKPTWTPADLSKYPDVNEVPGWALGAMQDAVALGLISGNEIKGVVYLDPNGNAPREQVATILMQFCKNVKK